MKRNLCKIFNTTIKLQISIVSHIKWLHSYYIWGCSMTKQDWSTSFFMSSTNQFVVGSVKSISFNQSPVRYTQVKGRNETLKCSVKGISQNMVRLLTYFMSLSIILQSVMYPPQMEIWNIVLIAATTPANLN